MNLNRHGLYHLQRNKETLKIRAAKGLGLNDYEIQPWQNFYFIFLGNKIADNQIFQTLLKLIKLCSCLLLIDEFSKLGP